MGKKRNLFSCILIDKWKRYNGTTNCHLVCHDYHRPELSMYVKISREKYIEKRYLCNTYELQRVK